MKRALIQSVKVTPYTSEDAINREGFLSAILAVKDTPRLIPMCHPILITGLDVNFEVDVARVRASGARVQTEPHVNPNAQQPEIWLRDPDGYLVVVPGTSQWRPRG